MSTLKVNTIQNTSGVTQYTAQAWVNFNGTGTVAIRASGNVSSITDNGSGDYTVNFTTAMPDANYSTVALASSTLAQTAGRSCSTKSDGTYSTTAVQVRTHAQTTTTGYEDNPLVSVSVFR